MLDKEKALEIALAQIEKQFGKGAIMKLGDSSANLNISAIPTGCIDLDIALGVGGIPRGRIVEIFGPESSGKTTIALHVVAQAQKMGGTAAFIDAEHALDPVYAESLVIDSVAALVPKAEIEGDMGDSHVGLQARLMSQALRKLTGAINKSNCVVIFINQLREKVGVMFGNPETTPGGKALKFYASVRLDVRRIETLKVGGEAVGSRTKGGQEQGGPALPHGGVRHALRRGHLPGGQRHRPGRGPEDHDQVRRLVQLRRDARRPGP